MTLAGGQRPAVRVKLNAAAVAAYGLNSETIRAAISNANVNSAKGSPDGPTRSVTLSANDQMKSADDYRQLIVAYQNGAAIRLQDIATIEQGAENTRLAALGQQATGDRAEHPTPAASTSSPPPTASAKCYRR